MRHKVNVGFISLRAWILACGLVGTLSSCGNLPLTVKKPPPPKTLQDGVAVTASTVYVRPWAEVVDSLSPKFANTPEAALAQIDQSQNFSDNRFLSALGVGAQVGVQFGPQLSNTDVSTRNINSSDSAGTIIVSKDETNRTVTTKKVEDNAAVTLPAAAEAAGGGRTAGALPDLIGATRNPSSEPFFHYSAANALFQEIALINDAVAGIPQYKDAKPYIIRLRLGVMPFRHDLPWDLYARFTLFEDRADAPPDPIVILPILSTEAFEGTLDASALEQVLDLRLSLQATIGNAKAGGNVGKLNDQLTTFLTRRYESTLHVTGESGRSIQVKFGASRDKTGYALGDRDHFVTIIAYLKPPYRGDVERSFRFYMDYEARDAKRGRIVTNDGGAFYAAMAPIIARLRLTAGDINLEKVSSPMETLATDKGGTTNPGPAEFYCDPDINRLFFNFSQDVDLYGGRRAILNLVACFKSDAAKTSIASSAFFLIGKTVNARHLSPDNSFAFTVLPLPLAASPSFAVAVAPQVQSNKKAFSIAVPYSGELKINDVNAMLIPNADPSAGSFAPRAITLKTSGPVSQVVLDFPPLASMQFDGIAAASVAKLKVPAGWDICVVDARADLSKCTAAPGAALAAGVYRRSLATGYAVAQTIDAPDFTISAPARNVKQAADGTVTFSLYVEPPANLPVKLTASDGELMAGGAVVNEITVTGKGMVTLTLRNPGSLVAIHAESAAAADATVKTSKDVFIAVQPPAASAPK